MQVNALEYFINYASKNDILDNRMGVRFYWLFHYWTNNATLIYQKAIIN